MKNYTEHEVIEMIRTLREEFADLEHEQWAHWTDYLFKRLSLKPNSLRVDEKTKKDFERWVRQITTPYKDLTEKEKDSDREWADKVIALINSKFMTPEGFIDILKKKDGSTTK